MRLDSSRMKTHTGRDSDRGKYRNHIRLAEPSRKALIMKQKLPLVFLTLIAAAPLCLGQSPKPDTAKPDDKTLIDNSRATWEAYKTRNVAAMKALTAEGYVSRALTGPSTLQQDIDTIAKLTIDNFTIDEPKVTWAAKDVGILHYKCDLKGSFEGKTFKPVYATEVWVNRGGKWLIIAYSETPVS